ncbi:MAG: glutamine amidotransferase [Candidatus Puniceispirillum sp. TMED52]|nr:glutamine amidotransferase [SAR116 cluster bacterium]OUU54770.1 MAG: glutamine amidotransferase [Candidatus Puniceispirillum sp. TMED52]|tara:strand:- start:1228 stop:2133 length:906 start_codon:yes stop_codon:yes gene_type:complete
MCGIVGLFLKDDAMKPQLGEMLSAMLITMTDRGPDSAGIAIYGDESKGMTKLTIQSEQPDVDFPALEKHLNDHANLNSKTLNIIAKDTHAVMSVADAEGDMILGIIKNQFPTIRIMSQGQSIEIYKEVGLPKDVVSRFALAQAGGSHGIGHTRMATESAVTTLGAHPFSTGQDQCLVHNGSLSNHNMMRRNLRAEGIDIQTENDSEVAAAYLTARMSDGETLGEALTSGLNDLDGFFTFVVGTKTGFGVLRDPIACKPAVMAETDAYVAFGSEYRALVNLPAIEAARVWEPEPAEVYFWSH